MKHLKKLTRTQKIFLSRQGLKPEEYKFERGNSESYTFYHVPTGKIVTMRR